LGFVALQVGCPAEAPKSSKVPAKTAEPTKDEPAAEPTKQEPATEPAAEVAKEPAAEAAKEPVKEEPATEPAKEPAKEAPPQAAETPKVPLGLPPLPVPQDNPITAEKVELGKLLYFDERLSKDGKIACATCHDPKMAYAEHEPSSTGIGGQKGDRNSPTVINAAYATVQFWDGRAASLEEQALGPIANPIEMGHELGAMVQDLSKLDGYTSRFQKVFGTGVTQDGVAKAIAAFERTILSGNSPYDRFKGGDQQALTDVHKRGLEVFDGAGCSTCHTPPLMSNYKYYNAGVGADKEKPDEGRKKVTGSDADLGKFRVPTLREIANTAPYFHDGSAATLDDAVALMAAGGKDNPHLSPMLKAVRAAQLTEQNRKDLVEFLNALSGEYPLVEKPKLP
jgi:cytochrome c peroxidase